MKVVRLFLFIICCNFFSGSYAAIEFNENCKKAYLEIYNFNFKAAQSLIDLEKTVRPDNSAVHYLEGLIDCFQLFNNESAVDYQSKKHKKKEQVNYLAKESLENPHRNYMIAEIYLFWAANSVKQNDFLKAAKELHLAYKFAELNSNLHPSFKQNLKVMSLLHIGIGSIPERYRWMVNIIGYKGSVNEGIGELNAFFGHCKNNSDLNYLLTEAFMLKIMMAIHINRDVEEVKALIAKANKVQIAKNSPMFIFILATAYDYCGRNDNIISLIKPKPKLYYLEYLKGLSLLYKLDATAEDYFRGYIGHGTKHFVKSSYQKIAWLKILNGDSASYAKNIAKVKKTGASLFESDKAAQKESEDQLMPNVNLLKARLLFDGGYYDASMEALKSIETDELKNQNDNLEFIYRFARVYDKLGNVAKAIEYYNISIELGKSQENHFAANAALNAAKLYESLNDYKNASAYYLICISLKGYSYGSIAEKAKQGLERVQKK